MLADASTSRSFERRNRSARVAALLMGNGAPDDAERARLRTFLDGAQDNIARYDEKMALLLKDMNALREERDALQCDAEDARTLLHPIRILSEDVLYEIFAHCVPEWGSLKKKLIDEPDLEYSSLNSRNAPWTLSHVCSMWRRVALSAPRLWSTIVFTFPKVGSKKLNRLPRFCYNLGVSMSRSGNADLVVAMTKGMANERIPDMISVLLAIGAARWRHLYFRARGDEFPALLSGLFFERLEQVILYNVEESRDFDGKPVFPFRATPRLRRIRLLGDAEEVLVRLPWSKITHYEGGICEMRKGTLRAMPNLTHLSLSVDDEYAHVDRRLGKLSFPNLTSLSLDHCPYVFFSALLPCFDIPAVTDFRLTFCEGSPFRPAPLSLPITDLFPNQLASLHIVCEASQFQDKDAVNLTSWLRLATSLTALSIHLPNIPNTLLHELHVKAKGDVLVPRLKSLDLWVLDLDEQLSESRVLSVLESRSGSKPNVTRLEEFCTNVGAGRFSEGRLQRWRDVCRKVKVFCPR